MQRKLAKKEEFYKIKQALKSLFPAFNEEEFDFDGDVEKIGNAYYFLIKNGKTVGVANAYRYKVCERSLWLGWFGVLAEHQGKGYGSEILALFERESKKEGYTHIRLFTDKFENDKVIAFYQKNGYKKEDYYCEEDPSSRMYKVLIFSKNLNGKAVEPWDNKNINLTLELKKQL